jgi:hypothetical protein
VFDCNSESRAKLKFNPKPIPMILLGIGIAGLTATTKKSGIFFSPILYKAGSLLAPFFLSATQPFC